MLTHMKERQPRVVRRGPGEVCADSPVGARGEALAAGRSGDRQGAGPGFAGIFLVFALPGAIWGRGPDALRGAARAAGWRDCDIAWERLQERALGALRDGDPAFAARLWRLGWLIAFLRFRRHDPRYAASLANLGLVARLAGRERLARRRYAAALRRWGAAPDWIDTMAIARRGRSSLFHLQSEALHWNQYDRSLRRDAMDIARDVASQLNAATQGQPSPGRTCDRWPGENPAIFDDRRKFLGGALLIAAGTREPDNKQH